MFERAAQVEAEKQISRRTDDIIFNIRYLSQYVIDKEQAIFDTAAETDVLEQNVSEVAEADVNLFGPTVYQRFKPELGQYFSLGAGTVTNAVKGYEALDHNDPNSLFESFRRQEEIIEEAIILKPNVKAGMQAGGKKVLISPSPTHLEADPEAALSFDYDDRTMFRVQALSVDGMTKSMTSYSVFEIPAKAWAAFLSERYEDEIEPTALAVMKFCNQMELVFDSTENILTDFIGGVANYLLPEDQVKVKRQLEGFLNDQAELKKQATYYAKEKLDLEKELACSLEDWAKPKVNKLINNVYLQLNTEDQQEIQKRMFNGNIYVDDYVAELAMRIKTVTIDNRAGLATLNDRTVKRMAAQVGLETALKLAEREHAIQQAVLSNSDSEFMVRRSEQQIAESGVGCGGGCSVSVVDLFSSEAKTAREAGLSGTLYESKDLDKNSKCDCAKNNRRSKVISDGSNVVCVTCGDFQVKGKRGSLKK